MIGYLNWTLSICCANGQEKWVHTASAGTNGVSIASFAAYLFATATFYVIVNSDDQFRDAKRADDLHKEYFSSFQSIPLSAIQNAVIAREGFFPS